MNRAALSRLHPKRLLASSRSAKPIISTFADAVGLVYFGFVSQRDDEHHIVRGMTVSTAHKDNHYCIGTYDEYDVVFVERTDTLKDGKRHVWHILEFDLKISADIPHAFIGSHDRSRGFQELVGLKYPSLLPTTLGQTAQYPAAFAQLFDIYVTPAHAVSLEHIITPNLAEKMGTHFAGLTVEIAEQALYVYSEKSHISVDLLTTMLQNGAWLAARIDENSR
jgi:hypothetical protein